MADIFSQGINTYLGLKDRNLGIVQAAMRYNELKAEREREIAEENRKKATQELEYYHGFLSNPGKRMAMSDEQVDQYRKLAIDAGTRAGVQYADVDPIPDHINKKLFDLKTDPDLMWMDPVTRLRLITEGPEGKYFFRMQQIADMQAQAEGQVAAEQSPQQVKVPKERSIEEAHQNPNQEPEMEVKSVPGKATKTAEERLAEQIFGSSYYPLSPAKMPERHRQLLNDLYSDKKPDSIRIEQILDLEEKMKALDPSRRDTRRKELTQAVSAPTPEQVHDNLVMEEKFIAAQIEEKSREYATRDEAEAATRPERERLFNIRRKLGWETSTEMPKHYGVRNPTTFQQDRTYEAMMQRIQDTMARFNESQELAMQRLSITQDRLDLAREQFESKQQNGGSGTDKYGRGPNAVALALSADEKKQMGPFFGSNALIHAPQAVRNVFAKQRELGNIELDTVSKSYNFSSDPEKAKAAKKAFAGVTQAEDKVRSGKGNVTANEVTKTAPWGKTYGPDACVSYVKDYLKHQTGKTVTNLRSLPVVGSGSKAKVSPGDVLELSPKGGYTVPHWVVVNPDGKTVSEFQSKKVGAKSEAIGITNNRPVDALRSRIVKVYRPGAKSQVAKVKTPPANLDTKFESDRQAAIANLLRKAKSDGKMPTRESFIAGAKNRRGYDAESLGDIWDYINTRG